MRIYNYVNGGKTMLTRSLALNLIRRRNLRLLLCICSFGHVGTGFCRPAVAIEAMQGINNTVRNAAFFPAFFLTPAILAAHRAVSLSLSGENSGARICARCQ